ncbi:MAG: hypothetical protein IJ719_13415 [Clostridia bacterium]|nr:hypothetical protein [Clostridia bacterium]
MDYKEWASRSFCVEDILDGITDPIIDDSTSDSYVETLESKITLCIVQDVDSLILEFKDLAWKGTLIEFSFLLGVGLDGDDFPFHSGTSFDLIG